MGLVSDLHEASLDASISASQLLRYTLSVASKLNSDAMLTWARKELSGYPFDEGGERKIEDLPDYRNLTARVYANDRWGRPQPCIIQDVDMARKLSSCPTPNPLPEIEAFADKGKGELHVSFEPEGENILLKAFAGAISVYRVVQISQCTNVINAVRNKILEWTITLQAEGVEASGTLFRKSEEPIPEQPAGPSSAPHIQAGNYYHFDKISQAPFQIQPTNSTLNATYSSTLDIDGIKTLLESLSQDVARSPETPLLKELKAEIETLRALVDTPAKKNSWISEGLQTVRGIVEKAGTELIVGAIKHGDYVAKIGAILGL